MRDGRPSVTARLVPSGDLHLTDLFELGSVIEQELRDGADGIVVTQGTDTLEETSYLLDLLVPADAPIAVTGGPDPRHPGVADQLR